MELFGLPGSGKTYLARALCEVLQRSSRSVLDFSRHTSPLRLSWEWVRDHLAVRSWMVCHPFETLDLWRQIRDSGQVTRRERKRLTRGWLKTIVRLQQCASHYDIILMDQGFLQLLWGVGYEAQPATWNRVRQKLLGLIPAPDVVILIDASPDVAVRRLLNRPGITSRVERDGPQSGDVMERAQSLTSRLRDELETRRTGWHDTLLIPVDNVTDGCSQVALETIAERLEQIADGDSSHEEIAPANGTFDPSRASANSIGMQNNQ